MKLIIIFTTLIILMLLNFSCKEDFSPKTEFTQKYILNSYIDLDYDKYLYTRVYASLSKLYDVNGYDPNDNKTDPTVSGPEIYINYRDIIYNLQIDTVKADTNNYGTNPIHYVSPFITNMYPNNSVTIYVKFHNGKVLSSKIKILEGIQLSYSYNFRRGFTAKINRFLWGNAFTISWGTIENRLFFPRMYITYTRQDTPGFFTKDIPYTYADNSGHPQPLYPSYITGGSFSFDYSAVDSAMAEISKGDENKQKYTALYINFDMIEMDEPLAQYYLSIHGSLDNYSVRLDQSVYSNINGGLGIFGSRRFLSNKWNIEYNYAHSFGYKSYLDAPSDSSAKK